MYAKINEKRHIRAWGGVMMAMCILKALGHDPDTAAGLRQEWDLRGLRGLVTRDGTPHPANSFRRRWGSRAESRTG